MPIDQDICECGHSRIVHTRVITSTFPCVFCTCRDHAEPLTDQQTCDDIDQLLNHP